MNQTWKETMLITSTAKRAWLACAAGALALTKALPAQAQLETALSAARQSSAASAAAQRQVEEADDAAGSAVREYRAVLQQLDNTRLFVAQQQIFLDSQASEIISVRNQLGTVEQIKQGMSPMMLRMTVELEDAIRADVPFRVVERMDRVARVQNALANPSVSPAEQYRQVLNAYKIEATYGYSTESYQGVHPEQPGNVVDFIRFGRTSFIFIDKRDGSAKRYDINSGGWVALEDIDINQIRQTIRVAREQAAPEVIYAPVTAAN
jgi:multidrug efflux pump subunit AcrA (membrane-fusion protein)